MTLFNFSFKTSFPALFSILLCGTSLAQTPALPSVMDYVNHPAIRSAKISPDGANIAMIVPKDDTETLVILDAATRQTKASFETRKNNMIYRYWWANEERIVFEPTIHVDGDDQILLTGDLYAINADGSKRMVLAGPSTGVADAFQVLNTLENDHDNILVVRKSISNRSIAKAHPEVLTINIYKELVNPNSRISTSNIIKQVNSPLPWGEVATDNSGTLRLAWAPAEDGKLQVKVLQDNQWKDVASFLEAGNDLASPLGHPVGFNSADTGIYYLSRSPQGTVGLSLFDIPSGESKLLYSQDRLDVTEGSLIWSSDEKEIIGVRLDGPHYIADNPDIAFHKDLDKALPGYNIDFLNFTQNHRKGLAMVSSPAMPPALFLLDRDTGSFKPVFSALPKLQGSPMTKPETLHVSARDGTPIEAFLTRAAGANGPAPLIVLIHGGPHGIHDVPNFNPEVKLLASRGYSVLQVNYRGSGGYGLPFQEAGYKHWGTTMIDDIIDVTRDVAGKGLVKADQMCVMGGSYGGYATMMALARYPDMFKCGVGISGVYDLDLMRKSDVPFIPGGKDYLDMVLGTDQQDLDANSPVKLAGAIKVPVFLAHGGEDRRAPIKNAERFKSALDAAHVKYEWFYVDSAGHGFALPVNREKLYTEIFKFLGNNLH